MLAYPSPDGKFGLYVDASSGKHDKTGAAGGIGACLMQTQEDGSKKVIGFYSRRLQPHEENYSAFLLEMLAATAGIDHYSVYLKGRHFDLYTDHRPLESLSAVHTKTLNRLQEKLLEYSFTIKYIKGGENVIADYLSRSAVPVNAVRDADTTMLWAQKQKEDPDPQRVVRFSFRYTLQ